MPRARPIVAMVVFTVTAVATATIALAHPGDLGRYCGHIGPHYHIHDERCSWSPQTGRVTPTPEPTPTPPIVRSNWAFRRGTFGHGGTYQIAAVRSNYFFSDDRYAEGPATLYVRCNNNGESMDTLVHFGDIYLAGTRDVMRVVHTFDEGPEQTLWWSEAVNNEAAFVPNAQELAFATRAVQASSLRLTITSYDGERTTARWTLRGADDPLHPVLRVLENCGRV